MSELRYIGKAAPRPEGPDKATGRATYIHDLTRPGMLYGQVRFSEHAHARILNIDTSKAERLPGVRAVITAQNTPEIRVGFLRDNLALKKDKVRQYRDEVAAVAAIDPDIAREAASLIEVEYEPLPAVFDPFEAQRPDAPRIHETDARGRPLEGNLLPLTYHHLTGDLEEGRRRSAHIAEGEFSTQWMQQSCMGTAGCLAEFDSRQNLTIWAKTQIPFLAQRDFNEALAAMGLRGKNARVIVPALGGGFGSGLDTHAYEYISILLAWITGRPVKTVYNRDEEFACLSPRQNAFTKITQGCDADGRLTFRQVDCTLDNGAYTSWGATFPTVMLLPATSLYKVPVVQFDARCVYTNNTYSQAMRGYGNPEVNWAIEQNLDELAEAAGVDPFDLRRLNCNEPGETTPMGLKVGSCGLRECLDYTAEKLAWKTTRGKQRGKRRGVGMASLFHVGGSGRIYRSDGSGVILKFDDFGQVNVSYGGVEMGQGLHSVLSRAVAEGLGFTPDRVVINQTDTATCPWDVGTHASRGAFVALNAALGASEKARTQILAWAVELLPKELAKALKKYQRKHPDYAPPPGALPDTVTAGELTLRDNLVLLAAHAEAPEPWQGVGVDRILRAAHFREAGQVLTVDYFYEPPSELPDWSVGRGNMSAAYAYGTQGALVEVDEETGEVEILDFVAAHDVGKVLNPQTLEGQMYGAIAQGFGFTFTEDVISEDGRILNTNFRDYKLPTVGEMRFPIDLHFVETEDANGPFGAKGVGEPGLVPTAPAIANAIWDAVGVRVRHLPITPEKLRAAIREKRAADGE